MSWKAVVAHIGSLLAGIAAKRAEQKKSQSLTSAFEVHKNNHVGDEYIWTLFASRKWMCCSSGGSLKAETKIREGW